MAVASHRPNEAPVMMTVSFVAVLWAGGSRVFTDAATPLMLKALGITFKRGHKKYSASK